MSLFEGGEVLSIQVFLTLLSIFGGKSKKHRQQFLEKFISAFLRPFPAQRPPRSGGGQTVLARDGCSPSNTNSLPVPRRTSPRSPEMLDWDSRFLHSTKSRSVFACSLPRFAAISHHSRAALACSCIQRSSPRSSAPFSWPRSAISRQSSSALRRSRGTDSPEAWRIASLQAAFSCPRSAALLHDETAFL